MIQIYVWSLVIHVHDFIIICNYYLISFYSIDPSQRVLISLRDELLVQTAHDLQHFSKLSPSTAK